MSSQRKSVSMIGKNYNMNKRSNNGSGALALLLLFLVLTISFTVAFFAIPDSLAAQVTMEVYQQTDGKAFGKETSLDIFSNDNHCLNGENLVAPFSRGSYTFAVYNSASSDLLPYTLNLTATNVDNIPLVISLEKNGAYIFGGAGDDSMLPLTEIDFKDLSLNGKGTDLYTIHWRWKTTNDVEDTAFGTLAVERDLIYKLVITVTGSIDETSLSQQPGGTSGNGLPRTGDTFNIWIWAAIMGVSLVLAIWVLFYKRKKKDENYEENRKSG